MIKISKTDEKIYKIIRDSVTKFQIECLSSFFNKGDRILDVAPQIHKGIRDLVSQEIVVDTLDIQNTYNPTYVADICNAPMIPSNQYDGVFLTEVIEHVGNPFAAIAEIHRILKPGALLCATSPFNFRIHGPLPDNWRITEHGWKFLLSEFSKITINAIEDENRALMPVHYRIVAKK